MPVLEQWVLRNKNPLNCSGNASQERQGLFKAFHHRPFSSQLEEEAVRLEVRSLRGETNWLAVLALTPGIPTGFQGTATVHPWQRMKSCHINNGRKWRRIAHSSPLRYLPRNRRCSGTSIITAQLQRSPLLLALCGNRKGRPIRASSQSCSRTFKMGLFAEANILWSLCFKSMDKDTAYLLIIQYI